MGPYKIAYLLNLQQFSLFIRLYEKLFIFLQKRFHVFK
jgi:hypothetical protein